MPKFGDLVQIESDPRLPAKPVDPNGGAPRGFSSSGREARTYGPTSEALKDKGLQLCKQNTPGNIYFVCALPQAEIDERKAQRENHAKGPQGTEESWRRSLPPDRTPAPAASRAGTTMDEFDRTLAAEREAASLDKVFCGGLYGTVEVEGQKVFGRKAELRACREADILEGDGGDASIGRTLKREVEVLGVSITVKGGGTAGGDPILAQRRLAAEGADVIRDNLAAPIREALEAKLRRIDAASGY